LGVLLNAALKKNVFYGVDNSFAKVLKIDIENKSVEQNIQQVLTAKNFK